MAAATTKQVMKVKKSGTLENAIDANFGFLSTLFGYRSEMFYSDHNVNNFIKHDKKKM